MIPKTVDITTLVGSIKGLDSDTITKQIIKDREEDEERDRLIEEAVKKR
jgi:hypothetical protein